MTIQRILIHPDPRLKTRCPVVTQLDGSLLRLADDMLETMYDAPGIGLAAPQVGALTRLFVMDCSARDDDSKPLALFNPEVVWASEELNTYEEGCLSIPEQFEDVTRPAKVRITFMTTDGIITEQEFSGLQATCVQHEIDHLNGKLFIDHISSLKRTMITKRMKKLKKERARA